MRTGQRRMFPGDSKVPRVTPEDQWKRGKGLAMATPEACPGKKTSSMVRKLCAEYSVTEYKPLFIKRTNNMYVS